MTIWKILQSGLEGPMEDDKYDPTREVEDNEREIDEEMLMSKDRSSR